MPKLHVESLESRRLLNGNSVAPLLLPLPSFPAVTLTIWMTERLPPGDSGGRLDSFAWGWPGEGSTEAGRLRSFAGNGFDGVGRDMHGPQPFGRPGPADPSSAETWGGTGRVGSNNPSGDPAAGAGRGTVPIHFLASATTPSTTPVGPANNGLSGAALPAILLQRLNPQPVVSLENPVAGHSLPSDMQGVFAVRGPAPAPRGREGPLGYAGSTTEEGRQTSGTAAPAQAPQERVLPSPKSADLLAMLPFFDDSALDVGIQQFLQQLERLCPRLASDTESGAWWPWVVAVTAAATAGEIARRELRRPSVVSAAEGHDRGSFPSELFVG
jgi:hypothetical protein